MYEEVCRATGESGREAFNCLVRIWADIVRIRPLQEKDRPAADRVIPLMPDLVRAIEDEGFFDPLGEVFAVNGLGAKDQILTPEPIVRFIVEQTVGKAAEEPRRQPVRVLDPCTGTGRFLIVTARLYAPALGPRLHLYGVELDLELYRACLVNMRLASFSLPYRILYGDALMLDLGADSPNWAFANRWDPPDWRKLKFSRFSQTK